MMQQKDGGVVPEPKQLLESEFKILEKDTQRLKTKNFKQILFEMLEWMPTSQPRPEKTFIYCWLVRNKPTQGPAVCPLVDPPSVKRPAFAPVRKEQSVPRKFRPEVGKHEFVLLMKNQYIKKKEQKKKNKNNKNCCRGWHQRAFYSELD